MSSIFGRAVIDTPTNKSGGALAKGDVVIVDTANDHAITTTTSASTTAQIGVVVEENGIANNAAGRVQFAGYVPLVNVNASVTRGHYGGTHTVAKQAASLGASRAIGAFCQFLTGGATPSALLFGLTDAAGTGGGAPTTSGYIVGALDAGLSNEKVRADLFKNYDPDNYPTSGLGSVVDEFDTGSLSGSWTWDTAPGGTVSLARFPGFLHIDGGSDATPNFRFLRQAFAPGAATAFSIASKMRLAYADGNVSALIGIAALTSADAIIAQARIQMGSDSTSADSYRLAYGGSSASTWKEVVTPIAFAPEYLLITRTTGNVYEFFVSADGMVWQYMGTITDAATVAKVAIYFGGDTDAGHVEALVDFVRTFNSVTRIIGA